jgi:hypothetical protein
MKFLVMQFLPSSLLGSNILHSTVFSITLSLYSFFNIRDQVSRTCKTTGKIIVLYILIIFHELNFDLLLSSSDP